MPFFHCIALGFLLCPRSLNPFPHRQRIADPAEVGLDVHSQLTELFQRKYGSRAEGESLEEDDSILSPM